MGFFLKIKMVSNTYFIKYRYFNLKNINLFTLNDYFRIFLSKYYFLIIDIQLNLDCLILQPLLHFLFFFYCKYILIKISFLNQLKNSYCFLNLYNLSNYYLNRNFLNYFTFKYFQYLLLNFILFNFINFTIYCLMTLILFI